LDDVSINADDAASKSSEVESAEEQFTSEKKEYDTCRSFPDDYDLLQDGCQCERIDAENAGAELESAMET
jgi:hypothetical protein